MKIRVLYILMIMTVLGVCATYYVRAKQDQQPEGVNPDQAQVNVPEKETDKLNQGPPVIQESSPARVGKNNKPPVANPAPIVEPHVPSSSAPVYDQAAIQRWNSVVKRFKQQQNQLTRETNPGNRLNMIRAMARHVRVDTPSTLSWALSLEDPEEKRIAMETINKNALTGIGARLKVDDTGLPKIIQTTEMGAVATSGQIEQGDYIAGKVNADGSIVYFNGRPIREIIQVLRGEPGSEVHLLMERASTAGGESYSYDAVLERSMIIVEPPF